MTSSSKKNEGKRLGHKIETRVKQREEQLSRATVYNKTTGVEKGSHLEVHKEAIRSASLVIEDKDLLRETPTSWARLVSMRTKEHPH